jgi:UDP-N-acetylmuramoyl-L-alanyl-D-glutamate--2,6-diaminopimelate ligase
MLDTLKNFIRTLIPAPLLAALLASYHRAFAWGTALWCGFPAKKLFVIGVTGTKGKSSTVEMVNAILEAHGFRTAVISTIRFKTDKETRPNLFKMTMPGRGFIQKVLREAVNKDCTHAIIELTSEGARQYRHEALSLNALIFTNIAREHIESHGSYEKYKEAKLAIGAALVGSSKRPRIVVANPEDELGAQFLELPVEKKLPFWLEAATPWKTLEGKISMTVEGATFEVGFPGTFTILNALAAATLARELGITPATIARALHSLEKIPGRVERIECGQSFVAIVDYAHTPDSLRAVYEAFPGRRKICVLGNTGGGRDQWKRPEMGAIADQECEMVILTDEDPYDEDPRAILEAMARGMQRNPVVIMDRREAIRAALEAAMPGDAVLVTGKGTDPFIMGAGGERIPWSDSRVVGEELEKLMGIRARSGV